MNFAGSTTTCGSWVFLTTTFSCSPAEDLLHSLGVTSPEEIDLDAIAYHVGVRVRYRPLTGCIARIIANGDRAIATIDENCRHERKRFSIGHELGHWHYHRGYGAMCTARDVSEGGRKTKDRERVANTYAAQLILPEYLVRPAASPAPRLSWSLVDQIASEFRASRHATVLRLIDLNLFPAMVVCHRKSGRAWFRRARDIPAKWFPQDQLSAETLAIECVFGCKRSAGVEDVPASAWFDVRGADRYEVEEESTVSHAGEVLSLLNFVDDRMLDEG